MDYGINFGIIIGIIIHIQQMMEIGYGIFIKDQCIVLMEVNIFQWSL